MFWGTLWQSDRLNNFGTLIKCLKGDVANDCLQYILEQIDLRCVPPFPVIQYLGCDAYLQVLSEFVHD